MNVGIYDKMRGTNVLFGTSTFLLIHKVSLKYLSLVADDMDNLTFELVDYPNETSFFKFMSSLKIQNQRNNFVYSNDQIYICNSKTYINQYPYIHLATSRQEETKNLAVELKANLEEKSTWRINIHQDLSVSEDKEFLKIGEVIWLHFSEKDYCLEAHLPSQRKDQALNWISSNIIPIDDKTDLD